MVSLFTINEPATNSPIQSAVIRENFEALYDKLKTLEVRAETTPSTSVLVEGGVVYFRAGSSNLLKLVSFNTAIFDFTAVRGFKTFKNPDGTLFRQQQAFSGPSAFESQGLFLETLLSLRPNGQLAFTEALTAQNNELSSPFNIAFDDEEIPLALIILQKSSEGDLQVIQQEDIRDTRPFLSAYQNNEQAALLEAQVEDNTNRVTLAETALRVTDAFQVRIPPAAKLAADGTSATNTKVEVVSGTGLSETDGYSLSFAGAIVDFSASATEDLTASPKLYDAGVSTLGLGAGEWNKILISAQYDATIVDPTENTKLVFTYGTNAVTADQVVDPVPVAGTVPLARVLVQMNGSATEINPLISLITIGSVRLNYEFPISNLLPAGADASTEIEVDLSGTGFSDLFVNSTLFPNDTAIEIFDDNTRSFRREIDTTTYVSATSTTANITLKDSFVGISLLRNPKIRSITENIKVIEDLRPYIGIS